MSTTTCPSFAQIPLQTPWETGGLCCQMLQQKASRLQLPQTLHTFCSIEALLGRQQSSPLI